MATEKFTAAQVAGALTRAKGMVSIAAQNLNCAPNTVRTYIDKYPSVKQALDDERALMTDVAELALYKKINEGEAWAVCFYLKTIGKDRGYVERKEVTGKDGAAVITLGWGDADSDA